MKKKFFLAQANTCSQFNGYNLLWLTDVIYIKNGVYEGNVAISGSEVTLIGDGKG